MDSTNDTTVDEIYINPLDSRLARIPFYDKRNENYPIRPLLAALPKKPRSYSWRCLQNLDQGVEGACVGFAWAHELIARPSEVRGIQNAQAQEIYLLAKARYDPWPGSDYDGTSTLAGIKAVQQLYPGKIPEYRHAFTVEDIKLTISYKGPVVVGVNWYEGMMNPDRNGYLNPTGRLFGGHCTFLNKHKLLSNGNSIYHVHNTWGDDWGWNGGAWITEKTLEQLMEENGEAMIAIKRAPETRRKLS